MTERKENVEPPLANRRVQVTLAVLATVALAGLLIPLWCQPSPLPVKLIVGEHSDAALSEAVLLRIDLNVAEPRELALLPGVGPVLASRIAENRIRMGPFVSVDDLSRVHGIGPKRLDQIREICVVHSEGVSHHDRTQVAAALERHERRRKGSFDRAGR